MSTNDVIEKILGLDTENAALKRELLSLRISSVSADRFYNAKMTVEMVASLHGVHPHTVRRYISLGLIEKHPDSTDAKMFVRGSIALKLDFSNLKKITR